MVRENHLAAFKKKNQFVGFHVQDPRFGNHTHQIVTASSGGFSPFETFFPAKKGHSKRKKIYAVLFGIVLLGVGIYLAVHFVNLSSASDNFPPQTTPPESEKAIWVNISESSFTVLKSEYYEIPFSRNDQIFALSKLSASDQVYLPAGRSYDGSNWEPVYPILLPFNCGSDSCKVRIPQGNEIFAITSTKASVRSDDAIVSDFLIQSTFGPTRAPIQSFPRSGNFYDRARLFLIDQMNKPATLLRAYYRQKVNALIEADSHPGRIRGPCEVGSRWFSLAFTRLDSKQEFRLDGNKLFVNGLLRTELSSNLFNLSQIFQGSSGPFYFCVIYSAQAAVGAQIPFRTASGSCDSPGYFSHPEIYFSSPEPEGISVIHRNAQFTLLNPSVQGTALLRAPSSNCIDPKHFNLFAKDGSSVWYRFQPRLVLLNNTLSNPTFESSLIPGWDPTAPKDFLNENDCKPRSVQKQFNFLDESITLNTTNLEKLSALSNSPVFYVDGLNTATPPCQAKTARFLRSKGLCSIPSSLSSANMILGLIQAADNGNIVIDVNITSGSLCSDLPAMVQIQASSECWKHVHSDYFSVYDFTQYLYEHPGGPDRIRNSANSKLQFPHPVSIWEENKAKLEYIGTYGSQIRFTSFPKKFLKYEIALNFNALVFVPGNSYGEFCGSIGEINNDPVVGDRFFIHHNYSYAFDGVYSGYLDDSNYSYTPRSKSKVWSNVVLKSEDQVRQRAAWALSQIFVINIGNIPLSTTFSESWLKYYDIFVRNAFSNYFDIMKEVSYNPMMGMMLSYFQSVSFQRNMEKDGKPIYPDENYARELMQLFSIGLWKLNKNGTRITDSSGRNLETYNNRNIQSFARIWTGFRPNKGRGNIELPYPHNMIDLMVISPEDHDTFPKEGLDGSFIGDQYPLCSRFLGSSNIPEMMAKLSSFEISSQQSALFRLLCNPDAAGACQLKSKITLSQNIPCFGIECEVDVIRTVKLKVSSTDFLYYEYVQQPCVNLEFPESGILTKGRNGDYPFCSDSTAIKASPACCSSGSLIAQERVKFEGETTTFDSSVKICSNFNQTLCDFGSVNVGSPQNPNNFAWSASRFWTSSKCNVSIQVFADGRVSLLHTNPSWTGTTFYGLQQNSNVKIRVGWLNSKFPVASNQCDGICQSIDGTCICGTSVVTRAVFTDSRRIPTVEDILQNLKIGAVDPSTFDAGFYSIAHQDSQKGLKVYEDSSKMFNENTIFEIRSIGTRVQYFANLKSTVELSSSSYSFRNPPNFMQHDERTLRDAEYEVDALLYHLLYHQSTAPFVADFLIKRFVTSNPSPNYVETVSNAFISGQYNGFGSGKYGDLASTFAAVLLYRDSISHVVKSDKFHGLIREPVIKVLHFMRALELRSTINSDFELGYWDNVLGQEVFMSPTVFNFYQSDFQPAGDIAQAKLFAPEAQSLNYPKTVAFTNTMINLVHFGLSSCFKGLSQSLKFENNDSTSLCYSFNDSNPSGTFSFEHYKSSSNFRELIIQLNTLLLGGRLDSYRQDVLLSLYEKAKVSASIDYAVKKVISALTITPEYQITSTAPVNLTASKKPSVSLDASGGYKAIVYVFLEGGMDSYNLLVPHSTCAKSDLYSQYAQIRQNGAISKSDLLLIDVPNWASTQPCQKFGINMAMPQVHQLYNSGEAAFIANIGTLVESLNSSEYYKGTKRQPVGIFAHNIQQKLARNLVSDSYEAKGILGKLKESLYRNNRSSKSYALRGYFAPILEGEDPKKTPQTILNPFGNVETLDEFFLYTSLNQYLWNLTSAVSDSVFGNTWNDIFQSSVSEASKLNDLLKFTPASSSYMNHYVSNQFNYASRIMSNRKKLNSATDIFYLEMNGFDSHDSFISFGNNARILDSGLKSFTEDLKAKGLWENVTIVVASEFGRTLRSNGYGSDHRWGGNAFILGESVKGGQILGSFPSDMQDLSEFNIGNGIFVPTSPWEAIWKPLLKWFDLSDAEIQAILPNMKNFDQEKLFSFDSVFKRLNSYSTPNDPPSLGYTIREKNGNTALLTDNEGILYAQSLSGSYRPIIPLHYKSFKDTGDFEVAAAENIDGLNYIVWRTLNADFALVIWTMDENSRILNNEYKPIFKGTLIYYEAERKFQEDFDIDGKISTP